MCKTKKNIQRNKVVGFMNFMKTINTEIQEIYTQQKPHQTHNDISENQW